MKISLKNDAKQAGSKRIVVHLQERLPERIDSPCELNCDFSILNRGDYYLLSLHVKGRLAVTCQRCLDVFEHLYDHQSEIAICADDVLAERLMKQFECIVALQDEIDLMDIVTDGLHLYVPEKHSDIMDCNKEIKHWIKENLCT